LDGGFEEMSIAAGTKLGRYEVRSKIGEGGMGEVYLAQDTKLDRKVALKILPAEAAADRKRMQRFTQEAKAASALNHPNILTIYEIEQIDSTYFIATEFIDGETLRNHLSRARMELPEALEISIQVTSALSAAHNAGIVHRDIKPENIMLRSDGLVKVLDFGLAKLAHNTQAPEDIDEEAPTRTKVIHTEPGVVLGTANYMSPEQARGLDVDARSDLWSLGVVLYEMVAGRLPFVGATTTDTLSMILHREPPSLLLYSADLPAEIERIVEKALAKDGEERYQTAKDLLIDLRRLKQHLDFESEIERTSPPESRSATAQPASEMTAQSAAQSVAVSAAVSTRASSAEYIVTEIKRHKKGFAIVAASVMVLAIIVIASYLWTSSRRAHALTDKDTIVLADFVNTTGDAVFDGTLKQALAVQLGQSPFLNIFGDDRVREALRFMGRSPDEHVTRDVAREICQRQGLKALLAGSISALGSHYVITLEAINAQSGDALAREQIEAENKEQVLKRLGEATTKLREQLGESLASIQKFDAPLEQVTTSSLEALKAYSLGLEQHSKGKYLEAVPFYKRAVELDPNFAIAYARLAAVYNNTRQYDFSRAAAQKAFDLRDRVSQREKLNVSWAYYGVAIGDLDKTIEVLELWKHTYPNDWVPHNQLANLTGRIPFEKAIDEAREAIRLNPNAAQPRGNLAESFIGLNRFDEAKQVAQEALALRLETPAMRSRLHAIALIQGDAAAMKQQIDWATGRSDEFFGQVWQAEAAAFAGQLRKERDFNQRAVELAQQHDQKEVAAEFMAGQAGREAIFGSCDRVSDLITRAFGVSRSIAALGAAADAFSLCGDSSHAQPLMEEISKRFPNATVRNTVFVPLDRAQLALHSGNAAQAIELLESAHRFEPVGGFQPQYVRGQAYLKLNKGAEAAAEFQKILDHRGWSPRSVLYPLAHLGLARAAALQGDTAKARKAYQDFFALWKDADPDIPILIEAKKEYEKLK
jgi:serine/threonine protein kinase/Flp pilus assembly protein TadD